MAEGCRFRSVIPNGEAGEIAVLRAFEPKADPSPPSGMLRSFGTTNKVKIEVLRAKSFPQDDKPKQTQANPSILGGEGIPVLAVCFCMLNKIH